jgi:hypothetical protein
MLELTLPDLVNDMAESLVAIDHGRASHKTFKPGIGPFGEAEAVRAVLAHLKSTRPAVYGLAVIKRTPDLLIPGQWAIEVKIIRPYGDNNKPAEHWSQNVLHPYGGNTSSIGDCLKLLSASLVERKAIVVFAFEHSPPLVPLEPAIRSFELIAREVIGLDLSPRVEVLRAGLIHPVHQQLRVYGYELKGRL